MILAMICVEGVRASSVLVKPIPRGIIGAHVQFKYADPMWDGLSKTVVFRAGDVTKDVLDAGELVDIPPEVVAEVGAILKVGVYGEGIPTLWAEIGRIRDATDPSGDESTDPSLPVWSQLQNQIDDLRENGSPGDGGPGENGGYYTPSVKQPDNDTLQFSFAPSKAGMPAIDPVEVALPAGPKGDDYTLTDADKKEIAEMAADLVEVPDSGGNVDYVGVEPAEDDMPKVFLTGSEFGNMTTAKNEVNMGLEYISKTDKFKAAIKIKFQGNTSLTFPKKNFTIKMYTDDTYEDKLKKSFKDWNHSGNKYVLKANWIDHAHARNIISARLWGEVVASRPGYDSLPVEMRNAPNNGAIDGFPVKLYVNGNYEGVYTWNVGKDDWMWGMDEDNTNHVLMCAETNNDGAIKNTPCNFRALWSGADENNWTVEVGTNSNAVKTALNNLIQFVMDNDGDAFRNGIDNYLDIQSAIDYYIFQYEICGLDGLAKNMLLATYDGTRWICGAYDMDATFGLYWNGSKFVSAQYRCPEDYQETYSLLWERIEANFAPELKARQAELRKTVLSYSNIVTHFERFMDIIGLDLYAEDLTIYTGIPSSSTNNIKQIRNFIRDRQAYVDAEFAAIGEGGEEEPDEPDVPDVPDVPDEPDEGANILDGVSWHYNTFNGITGAEIITNTDISTDAVDVSAYAGKGIAYKTDYKGGKIGFWDESGVWISGIYNDKSIYGGVVPANAKTMRLATSAATKEFSLYFGDNENLLNAANENVGMTYSQMDGTQGADSAHSSQKIALAHSVMLEINKIVSGAFYDANDTYVGGITYDRVNAIRYFEVTDGMASAGLNYQKANTNVVYAHLFDECHTSIIEIT